MLEITTILIFLRKQFSSIETERERERKKVEFEKLIIRLERGKESDFRAHTVLIKQINHAIVRNQLVPSHQCECQQRLAVN